jgi:outer membrane protein assembly factor BamB
MRCPNPVCREVFQVPAAQPADEAPIPVEAEDLLTSPESPLTDQPAGPAERHSAGPQGPSAGTVGDVVPILDAEVVDELPVAPLLTDEEAQSDVLPLHSEEVAEPPKPTAAPSWHLPPPVRHPRAPAVPPPGDPLKKDPSTATPEDSQRPVSKTDLLPAVQDEGSPRASPSWQLPPPTRRPLGSGRSIVPSRGPGQSVQAYPPDAEPADEAESARRSRARASRRAIYVIGFLVTAACLIISTVVVMSLNAIATREDRLFTDAHTDYSEHRFARAASRFQELTKDYPKSKHLPQYQFLGELSDIQDQVDTAQSQPQTVMDQLRLFLHQYRDDPLLKEYQGDVRQTLRKLAERLSAQADEQHDPAFSRQARDILAESERYKPTHSDPAADQALRTRLAAVEAGIAQWQKTTRVINHIEKLARAPQPSVDMVKEAQDLAAVEKVDKDPRVQALIGQMHEAVRHQVRYVSRADPSTRGDADPVEPSLVVAPLVTPPPDSLPASRRVILALVRGVLYALDQNRGDVLWVSRVGIDAATLPVRLPASEVSPELFLVLSADAKTLMALVARDGTLYWQHRLSAACLGRPVVVGQRAYVPTYDGRVHEIEILGGNALGYFELGQPLTVGGVWQEGTDLLYFPGDSDNLYVLDLARSTAPNQPPRLKQCVAVLHTGHPSGSLRSEPLIVNRFDPFAKTASNQASWPSYLILTQADGLEHMKLRVFSLPIENSDAPPLVQPEPRIRGWSWFQPYHDTEKLAFITDVGALGLFGINQVRNEDRPLFPQLREDARPAISTLALGRAQVVHAVENNFWVLANGELQLLTVDIFNQKVHPLWPAPLSLGSPLHASQLDEEGKTLFVVTQDLTRLTCLATAVEAETGKVLWQRQLGLEGVGDPLVLGREVFYVDRAGAFLHFEGAKQARKADVEWRLSQPILGKPLDGGAVVPYLLPGPDGASVYEVACPERGVQLTIRKFVLGPDGVKEEGAPQRVELPAPLAGTPALSPQSLTLLLSDRTVQRVSLSGGAGAGGPNWRSSRADDDARGYIVQLDPDSFLTTDGSRGVTHWHWPMNQPFTAVEKRVPTVELPARIVAAPLVLPRANPQAELQVIVPDSDDNLTLLRGPDLKPDRSWSVRGRITAGPFLRGQRIGCVVDRQRLVWIDPEKGVPLWDYRIEGESIVGQPQLIEDMLVVADLSGRLIGLNPETGQPRGDGYVLKARAAPVATPVACGPNQAFVPLTDGTVFLLDLKRLR